MSSLNYYQGDERPAWEATVQVNGVKDDMTSGYTFAVAVYGADITTPAVTKSSNITGAADGVVTVQWVPNELDIDEGSYVVQLTATRVVDGLQWTIKENLHVAPRA